MSPWERFAYGTVVAAYVIGGGIAIFYSGGEAPYVKAPTDAEIVEAVLERSAAVADWPFTCTVSNQAGWNVTQRVGPSYIPPYVRDEVTSYYGAATWEAGWAAFVADYGGVDQAYNWLWMFGWDGQGPQDVGVVGTTTNILSATNWNFNPYPGVPLIGSGPSRNLRVRSMLAVESLIPKYVMEVSNGVPVMWDRTNFWAAAKIGDLTPGNWTVAVASNGTPIYGPATNLSYFASTNTSWELHRALSLMTGTHRNPTFLGDTNFYCENDYEHTYALDSYEPDGDPNGEAIVQELSHFDLNADQVGTPVRLKVIPAEEWTMNPVEYSDFKLNWSTLETPPVVIYRTNILYTGEGKEHRSLKKTSWIWRLDMPHFPDGVQADITSYWAVTGTWTRYSATAGVSNSVVVSGVTNVTCPVVFSGNVQTGIYASATWTQAVAAADWVPAEYTTLDHPMLFSAYSTNITPINFSETWLWRGNVDSNNASIFKMGGNLYRDGGYGDTIINWRFTRCVP